MALSVPKNKFIWICQGVLPPRKMLQVVKQIIWAAGMTPARRRRVDYYPYGGTWWRHILYLLGLLQQCGGGEGYTLFQPLMESYLMADVYTDSNQTEILLSTCKPERMNTDLIESLLIKNFETVENKSIDLETI